MKKMTITLALTVALLSVGFLSSVAQGAQCTKTITQKFPDPSKSGLRIDKCVQGAGWGLADPKRCDKTRRKNAADAFCRTKQFNSSKSHRLRRHVGNHSIYTFPKGSNSNKGFWTQAVGGDSYREIICQKRVKTNNCKETKKFKNPTQRGLRIDRCVQGAGWGLADPKRCDKTRRKNAADAFCREKKYRSSVSSKNTPHVGNHSIWTFSKKSSPRRGSFTQTPGASAIKEIVCERPKK
jgi:hypothetical protein